MRQSAKQELAGLVGLSDEANRDFALPSQTLLKLSEVSGCVTVLLYPLLWSGVQ